MNNHSLLYPVKLKGNSIFVLDETKLPFKEYHIKVNKISQALRVLSSMKTRAFGQVLLFLYSAILFEKEISPKELAKRFKKIRPTFDFESLSYILENQTKAGLSLKELVKNFIESFDRKRRERTKKLAEVLPFNSKILTICNVSGELIYLYEELKKLKKRAIFYVSETRPYLQGTRLTFWELRRNNIKAYLLCDNQVAYLMQKKEINCVVVGSDRSNLKNDIINKIGTYAIARLAKYFKIPFYVLTQYPKDIDLDLVKIEERNKNEVFMFLENIKTSGYDAIYPSFDITKSEFIEKTYEIR